jgi:hypothetical protein
LKADPEIFETFVFSDHLNYMLGFKESDRYQGRSITTVSVDNSNGIFVAQYPANLNTGATSLYVYTDIVQPNVVANKMTRLLRIVNGTGNSGQYVTKDFVSPFYLPLASSTINSVEIEIKDEMDQKIKFSFGITIVLLHFRRKRPLSLL